MIVTKELDKKYAKMWNQACGWKIPDGITPFKINRELSGWEINLFAEACWHMLHMMATDGLISQQELRKYHEKERGQKRGWSKIDAGFVPKKRG